MSLGKKMTEEEYRQSAEKHSVAWWIWRVIALILIIGTFAVLVWRMFSAIVPEDMKTMVPNQKLKDAFQQAKAEERELTAYYNELDNITRAEHNYGYFSVSHVVFIEEAQQVQFTFRYNNSTIRHLKEDYQLDEMPDRLADLYDVTLYVAYDLTPADTTDNDGNDPAGVKFVRYHATTCTADATTMYNYRRFVFDGVDMTGDGEGHPVLAVYIDIYYCDDIHYTEGDPYGTLIIYDYASAKLPYSFTKKDKQGLEE